MDISDVSEALTLRPVLPLAGLKQTNLFKKKKNLCAYWPFAVTDDTVKRLDG